MSEFPPRAVSPSCVEKPGRNWARERSVWSPSLHCHRRVPHSFPSKWGATPSFSTIDGVLSLFTTNPIHLASVWLMKPSWPFRGGAPSLQVLAAYWPFPPANTNTVSKARLTFPLPFVAGSIIGSCSTYTPKAPRTHLWLCLRHHPTLGAAPHVHTGTSLHLRWSRGGGYRSPLQA